MSPDSDRYLLVLLCPSAGPQNSPGCSIKQGRQGLDSGNLVYGGNRHCTGDHTIGHQLQWGKGQQSGKASLKK